RRQRQMCIRDRYSNVPEETFFIFVYWYDGAGEDAGCPEKKYPEGSRESCIPYAWMQEGKEAGPSP
ncbi:hypothetical protein, partial [uncultured Desulfovibrio sp.]|uniref:hypothetical protein n=1 Tax=uncultured Desulfovibrio sp. TaxID=167968 RepID=UPI0028040E3C